MICLWYCNFDDPLVWIAQTRY